MTLTPCSDLSAARWITTSDAPWDRLVTFGPAGFPAYARLRLLPDPEYAGQSENEAETGDGLPESAQLAAVLEVLSRHTRTPDDCYFCLWDGWFSDSPADVGVRMVDLPTGPALPGLAPPVPPTGKLRQQVVVPNRAYFLFHGRLSEVGDWGTALSRPDQPLAEPPGPAFVWPADHDWCVAHDVDPHWIGIGAATSAIDELATHPLLDVVPADPDQDQPRYR